jgi:hypothetical protein
MHDILTLLATATDDRLERFAATAYPVARSVYRRKQTIVFTVPADQLPALKEAAVGSAVTLQQVLEPGREETYKMLHQGPMEGWGNHVKV